MRYITFNDEISINIDRVDGLQWDAKTKKTHIYVGGADTPFVVNNTLQQVLDAIASICEATGDGEKKKISITQ